MNRNLQHELKLQQLAPEKSLFTFYKVMQNGHEGKAAFGCRGCRAGGWLGQRVAAVMAH